MKVQFSATTDFTPEFNKNKELPEEQRLKFEVRPMTTLHLIDLTEVIQGVGFQQGEATDMKPEQMKVLVKEAGKYLPIYTTMHGAEGFTLQQVVDYPAFLALATEVLFQLLNVSSPNQDDVKNS